MRSATIRLILCGKYAISLRFSSQDGFFDPLLRGFSAMATPTLLCAFALRQAQGLELVENGGFA